MDNYSQAVNNLVQRIVQRIAPLRIILLGAGARNNINDDSDIHLLVVMPEGTHRRKTAQLLYKKIRNISIPFVILVVTSSDLENYKDSVGLIYREILAEGKQVYVN